MYWKGFIHLVLAWSVCHMFLSAQILQKVFKLIRSSAHLQALCKKLFCHGLKRIFRCIVIAVIGAIGNLLTLTAIPWAQRNKFLGFNQDPLKYTTIFILNLAFADFLYCITNLPVYAITVSIYYCFIS